MSDAEFIGGKAGPEDNAEWLRWAAETYASAVAKGGCYAPEPEWDVDAISPRLREAAAEIERLRARVEVLEKHLGLMIANNLTGSCESEGMATDRAIAVLPDWLEKANGYTRLQLDAADEIVQLQVEKAKP